MSDRKNKAQRRLLNRRVLNNSPIERLNIIPQPVANVTINQARLGRFTDFSNMTRGAGQGLAELASALEGFGNEMINFGVRAKAEEERQKKKAAATSTKPNKAAEKAAKEAAAQGEADELEALIFGGIEGDDGEFFNSFIQNQANLQGALTADGQIDSIDVDLALANDQVLGRADGETELPDNLLASTGDEVDIKTLVALEESQKNIQEAAYQSLPPFNKDGSQFIDPRFEIAGEMAVAGNTLQGMKVKAEIALEGQNSPDFQVKDLVVPYLRTGQEMSRGITKASTRKAFLAKVATGAADIIKGASHKKIQLNNQVNEERVRTAAASQLDSIFDTDINLYSDVPAAKADFQDAVRTTVNDLRLSGIADASEYYAKEILEPRLIDRIEKNPEDAIYLIESLKGMPLNDKGAVFGTTGEASKILTKYYAKAVEIRDSDPAERYKELYSTKTFGVKSAFLKFTQENPTATQEDFSEFKHELRGRYVGSPIEPDLMEYIDTVFDGHGKKTNEQNLGEVKQYVAAYMMTGNYDSAEQEIDEAWKSGKIDSISAFQQKQFVDEHNVERKLKRTEAYQDMVDTIDTQIRRDIFDSLGEISREQKSFISGELAPEIKALSQEAEKAAKSIYIEAWKASELPPSQFELSATDEAAIKAAYKPVLDQYRTLLQGKAKEVFSKRKEGEALLQESLKGDDKSFWEVMKEFFGSDSDKKRGI